VSTDDAGVLSLLVIVVVVADPLQNYQIKENKAQTFPVSTFYHVAEKVVFGFAQSDNERHSPSQY
jgi:hypothetical protein